MIKEKFEYRSAQKPCHICFSEMYGSTVWTISGLALTKIMQKAGISWGDSEDDITNFIVAHEKEIKTLGEIVCKIDYIIDY